MADKSIQRLKAAELDALGVPLPSIAQLLGIHYNTLSTWRNKDQIYMTARDEYFAKARESVQEHLKVGALKAYTTLIDILDKESASDETKIKVAESILNRAGINSSPQEQSEGNLTDAIKLLQRLSIQNDKSE